MHRIRFICLSILLLGLFASVARSETLQLTNGTSITGEIVLPGAVDGLNVRIGSGQYQRVPWTSFTDATLQELAKNPKLVQFIEPLLGPSEEEIAKMTEVEIKPVARLDRPEKGSLIGAMFSTGLGLVILAILYAANIYAAYEISVVHDRPRLLVCGICAVVPIIGQIVFLCLPERSRGVKDPETEALLQAQAQAQTTPHAAHGAPEQMPQEATGGLRLSQSQADPGSENAIPETQVFQRGKFMFNRRFFETKFSGFFGVVRRDTEKDMLLIIKSARGEFEAHRITRISANEMHLDVHRGGASQEVAVPFTEIQEVKLKHRNSPD